MQNNFQINSSNQNKTLNNQNEKEEYLTTRLIPKISEENFNLFIANSFNSNDLISLRNHIDNLGFPNFSGNSDIRPVIGQFNTLSQLIETYYGFSNFKKGEMIKKYSILNEDIYKYRSIKGDGNCFYRALLFSYFEQIILYNDLNMLKNVIMDVDFCIKNFQINKQYDYFFIVKILILIYIAMKKSKIDKAYEILTKSFLNFTQFDLGLIYYLRFILFRYIKDNKDKLYTKNFAVKIGNLLPSEYETEKGEFLFDSFFNNFLLKMGKDAEKIIIYISPFVMGMKVDVVMFDIENDWRKSFEYYGEIGTNRILNISLLNKKNHYELIYTREYYRFHYNIFKNYINKNYVNKVLLEIKENIYEEKIENLVNLNVSNDFNNNNNNNNNNNQNKEINLLDFNDNLKHNNINNKNNNNNNINSNLICKNCNNNNQIINYQINLCVNCSYNKFISNVISNYQKTLKTLLSFYQTCGDSILYSTDFMNMFINSKIEFSKNFLCSTTQSMQFLNKYFNNQIYIQNIIPNIKKNYCLNCYNKITSNNKIIIPCNCCFCSINCLNENFTKKNLLNMNRKTKDFMCQCSNIYQESQIINLIFLFNNLNNKELYEKCLNLFKKITENKCSKCMINIKENKNTPVYIQCKNISMDVNWKKIGDVNFNHLLCENCYKNITNPGLFNQTKNKNYFCVFCKNEHVIIDKYNSYVNDYCIIF